ncbi:replicative helicase loader/inhibitor [Neobacillus soli]|uniref:replicative helicase loader/inhibitor n=1 Tax=Neobacillus soli TaxID=220688 RepID=UPI000826210C|nr:replicative helicase loader/inhibitor [Neobacillus soli]
MTKQEVIKLLVLIESVYSSCLTRGETVLHWFKFCQELDYKKVMGNLQNHIRNSPYPPTIAEIAVFKTDRNALSEELETWILERSGIEQDSGNEIRRPISAWMCEYIPRKLTQS